MPRPLARAVRLAVTLAALPALGGLSASAALAPVAASPPDAGPAPSPAVAACEEAEPQTGFSARVKPGAKQPEPPLYAKNEAKKYGVIEDRPTLPAGSVAVATIFHVVTAARTSSGQRRAYQRRIDAQVDVLNDAFAGRSGGGAADTAFRFDLTRTTWTANADWATLSVGKEERAMKTALHEGDSETLNVYVTGLGDDLLGFAYFPKGYNNGRDYLDGVVILDGTMPGGDAAPYDEGDTATHEVGHWLALEHTFAGGCSASGDGVADTPREAYPQFDCDEAYDTCPAPGFDPIHNFMDYVTDVCMDEFTPGQAARMSDAWQAFRAGGNG